MDIDRILTLAASAVALVSTIVAVWAMITKRRDEARGARVSEEKTRVDTQDVIADTAREWVEVLSERATEAEKRAAEAEEERDEAKSHVKLLQQMVADGEETRAALTNQNCWLRDGCQRLVHQLLALDIRPVWEPSSTEPMPATYQVQRLVRRLLQQNHAKELAEAQAEENDRATKELEL